MNTITLRMVAPADLDTAAGWAKAHGARFVPAIMPKLGVVALDDGAPVAMCWLHMDNSVGVCWPEMPVSKPGLSIKAARRAFAYIMDFLEEEAARLDYGVMICHTSPGIAKVLQSMGFHKDSDCVKMIKLLKRHGT